jgi:Holliday junction DNA helicase RuvB
MDKRLLRLIAQQYKGGPVGMSTIAVAAGEESDTLEEVHEPFLIQSGLLQRTPQGRVITDKGLRAIGLKSLTGDSQSSLF